jgi:GNAT superfamily N-acetyltransferase
MDQLADALRAQGDLIAPLPSNTRFAAQTKTGEREAASETGSYSVRSIEPGDALAYRSILERTSEEDRYCRFFHVVNHFELRDIKRFVEPREDTIGFIAEDGTNPLGVAHAFLLSDASAEVAIVVASDARHHGIGHSLLEHIVAELRARHCETASAVSLSANSAFAHLAKSIGMTPIGAGETTNWTLHITAE